MVFPWIAFLKEGEDDLPDHFLTVPYFNGTGGSPSSSGGMSIGFNDVDTTKFLLHTVAITEGSASSVHLENNTTDYQNTTGQDAFAVLVLNAVGSGTVQRHVKIWSGGTVNSISGATLLFEINSAVVVTILDNAAEKFTTPILTIQNNHYLTIENVDDSRAGTNDISVASDSWVVERG